MLFDVHTIPSHHDDQKLSCVLVVSLALPASLGLPAGGPHANTPTVQCVVSSLPSRQMSMSDLMRSFTLLQTCRQF